MNKKIICCLVSTIFLIQSVAYLPSKAVCNENHPVSKTLQQNKSQEKKSSIFKSIFLGAGIGGIIVAAVSTGLGLGYSRVSNRKSENISDDRGHNPNLGCDEDFRKHWRYDSAKEGVIRHRIQDEKINDLAKQWKREHGTPVRAIKWHSNLCWLHSSILLLFHERHYNELICNFPVQEAQHLIDNSDLQPKDKARLKFMICLSKIFNILMGDPNVPAECVDLEPTELEKELVEKYNNINQGPPITYGLFGETMNRDIALEIIPEVIKLIGDSVQNLHKAFIICPTFANVNYNDDSLLRRFGERAFRENNKLVIIGKSSHFYVSLFVDDNNALTLGKSLSREKAIAIENSSSSKFTFDDAYDCDYSGEIKARCLIDSPNGMFDHNQVRRILKNVINNANKELCIARERNHYSDDDCKSLIDALSEAYLKYVEFEKFVKQKGSEEKLEAIEAAKERIRNLLSEIDKSREQCEFAWQKEVAIGCLEVAVDALVGYILTDCYNKSDYDPPPSTLDAFWNTTTIEEYIGQQLEKFPSKASEDQQLNLEKAKRLMEQWKEAREAALKLNNHSDKSNGGEEVLKQAKSLAIELYSSLH